MKLLANWIIGLAAASWLPFLLAFIMGWVADLFYPVPGAMSYVQVIVIASVSTLLPLRLIDKTSLRHSSLIVPALGLISQTFAVMNIYGMSQAGRRAETLFAICDLVSYLGYVYVLARKPRVNAGDTAAPANLEKPPAWIDYFMLSGRAGLFSFWMNFIVPAGLLFVICTVEMVLMGLSVKNSHASALADTDFPYKMFRVFFLWIMSFYVFLLGVVKRHHDHDDKFLLLFLALLVATLVLPALEWRQSHWKAGVLFLLAFTGLSFWQFLLLGVFSGTAGVNRHGPDTTGMIGLPFLNWSGMLLLIGLPALLLLPLTSRPLLRGAVSRMHVDAAISTSSVFTSRVSGKLGRTVSVLFIGNSYTSANNMPGMIADLATSDMGNTVQLSVQSLTCGGCALQDFVANGSAARAIASQHWDYVVLQDESDWAMHPYSIRLAEKSVSALSSLAGEAGAKPVMFVTWAYKDTSDYSGTVGISPEALKVMQQTIDLQSAAIAQASTADMVMVGDNWSAEENSDPDLDLYTKDGAHPTVAGTYLAALDFVKYLTGRKPTQTTFVPPDLTVGQAEELRIAATR